MGKVRGLIRKSEIRESDMTETYLGLEEDFLFLLTLDKFHSVFPLRVIGTFVGLSDAFLQTGQGECRVGLLSQVLLKSFCFVFLFLISEVTALSIFGMAVGNRGSIISFL